MAEAAVAILLEEVEVILKWHKNLISDSENELEHLKEDLSSLKAFLRDADVKSKEGATFRDIERQIRDVVYDVEDTIDTCLTAAAKSKSSIRRRFGSKSVSLAKHIKNLREDRVKPIIANTDIVRVNFASAGVAHRAGTSSEEPPSRPRKIQLIRRHKHVGLVDQEVTLIGYLREQKEELDVISIIGMPGLGKTTLAWKIFESHEIRYVFPTRIWVYVTQRFNSRNVFLSILRKFTNTNMLGLSDEELATKVGRFLAEEKFLLVMDDVWSCEDWNAIKRVLPKSNGLSKVMITSREWSVGVKANVCREPHMLRFLTVDESWKLLQLEVFGKEEDCPPALKGIGKQIAHQCRGVPLIVVVVGGMLVDLFVKTHTTPVPNKGWENVSENLNRLIQDDRESSISDIVEMSYNRLPDYLKECFLYTAVFPEGYEISAWTLMRLWIAEGLIRPEERKTLEEIAEENLNYLISRNLLMVDSMNPLGEIKTCRVQDTIRAFCRSKATKQNIFQEITKNKEGVLEPPVSEETKFSRICFNSDLTKFLSGKPNGRRIRSFLSFYIEPVNLDPEYISTIPDAFGLLRVLESMSIKFPQFPEKLIKLIHLRYITLNIDDLTVLAEPLSQLWNLQTLVVETKSRTITMKANIWRMYKLRNLKTKAAIELDKKWEGEAGENLHTMTNLSPESCTEDVSSRACNLKTLGIQGDLSILFATTSLQKFDRLEKLNLVNDVSPKNAHTLQPNCFPPNLKRLTLSHTFLEWSQISSLAKINTLEVLKLKHEAFIGIRWTATGEYCFPNLRLLLIDNTDLVLWEVSTNVFPSLQYLVLKNCENLIEIPRGLANTLEKLDINRLRKSAVESAREIMEVKRRVPFKLSIGLGCGY